MILCTVRSGTDEGTDDDEKIPSTFQPRKETVKVARREGANGRGVVAYLEYSTATLNQSGTKVVYGPQSSANQSLSLSLYY